MILKPDAIITAKLCSGEELIFKVVHVPAGDRQYIGINEPFSIAPTGQGLGMIPCMFTADPKAETILNMNTVTVYSLAEESIKIKYIETVTGLKLPESKKLILG